MSNYVYLVAYLDEYENKWNILLFYLILGKNDLIKCFLNDKLALVRGQDKSSSTSGWDKSFSAESRDESI